MQALSGLKAVSGFSKLPVAVLWGLLCVGWGGAGPDRGGVWLVGATILCTLIGAFGCFSSGVRGVGWCCGFFLRWFRVSRDLR